MVCLNNETYYNGLCCEAPVSCFTIVKEVVFDHLYRIKNAQTYSEAGNFEYKYPNFD